MSKHKQQELGLLTKIKTGKLDANKSSEDGKYPFFTCSKQPLRINTYGYDCECVLVAGNGDLNVKYYNGKFDAYQRTYIIESMDKMSLDTKYLFHFLDKYVEKLREQSIGGVIKYIRLQNLERAIISLPPIETQKNIAETLDKASEIISLNKKRLEELDNLIKAVFYDMFGDPVNNEKGWKTKELDEVCSRITDGEHLNPKFQENGKFMVMANNIKDRLDLYNCKYISEKDYAKFSSKCKPEFGDILLVSRGATIGRACINHSKVEFSLMGSVILLKLKKDVLINQFFVAWLKNEKIIKYITVTSSASAQQAIYIKDLRKREMILPPLNQQIRFAEIVTVIEEQKDLVRKAIDKSENLFNSLMTQYFD